MYIEKNQKIYIIHLSSYKGFLNLYNCNFFVIFWSDKLYVWYLKLYLCTIQNDSIKSGFRQLWSSKLGSFAMLKRMHMRTILDPCSSSNSNMIISKFKQNQLCASYANVITWSENCIELLDDHYQHFL